MDILEKQSRLIESQRTLFINTVEQFKQDLTYLRGTLSSIWASFDRDEPARRSVEFSLRHIDEMHSMLNDFDLRMSNYERN